MDSPSPHLRVLLPAKPEDDLEDVSRVLRAFLPVPRTHLRRLYVHRPVKADFYVPRTYPRFNEIAQLEQDAENATRVETEREMKTLSADGFRVSADVIRGTPTEEVLRESSSWRADLVGVRTRSLLADDHRIGGLASALLYNGDCPILTHHHVPEEYRLRRILIPTDFSEGSRAGGGLGARAGRPDGSGAGPASRDRPARQPARDRPGRAARDRDGRGLALEGAARSDPSGPRQRGARDRGGDAGGRDPVLLPGVRERPDRPVGDPGSPRSARSCSVPIPATPSARAIVPCS